MALQTNYIQIQERSARSNQVHIYKLKLYSKHEICRIRKTWQVVYLEADADVGAAVGSSACAAVSRSRSLETAATWPAHLGA